MPQTVQGKDYYFKLRTLMFIREAGTAEHFRPLGLVDEATLTFNETVDRLRDVRRSAGGTASVDRDIESGEITLRMREGTPENLALGWFATQTAVVAGSVVDAPYTAQKGQLIYVGHTDISNVEVTSDPAGTTYTLGTDYTFIESGAFIVPGGTIADDAEVLVSFDYGAQDVLDGLTTTGKTWELLASAENKVQGGAPSVLFIPRVRFGPSQGFEIQGAAEHGSIQVTGEILRDGTLGWFKYRNRKVL